MTDYEFKKNLHDYILSRKSEGEEKYTLVLDKDQFDYIEVIVGFEVMLEKLWMENEENEESRAN